MINSDWMDVESVVVGDHGALVGLAEQPVEPDTGGQREQPLRHPDEHAATAAATVAFQAELVFEVSKTDSTHWRSPPSDPNRAGSSVRSGRTSATPRSLRCWANAVPAKPLSATMMVPGARPWARARSSSSASATSRSPSLGLARHQVIGRPSGAHTRYSLNPQNQRLWLARQP